MSHENRCVAFDCVRIPRPAPSPRSTRTDLRKAGAEAAVSFRHLRKALEIDVPAFKNFHDLRIETRNQTFP